MEKKQKITWQQLKDVANAMSEELLKREAIIWGIESGSSIDDLEVLGEDYVFDGDGGCAPISEMKELIAPQEWDDVKDEYHIVHPKGTVIIYVNKVLKDEE